MNLLAVLFVFITVAVSIEGLDCFLQTNDTIIESVRCKTPDPTHGLLPACFVTKKSDHLAAGCASFTADICIEDACYIEKDGEIGHFCCCFTKNCNKVDQRIGWMNTFFAVLLAFILMMTIKRGSSTTCWSTTKDSVVDCPIKGNSTKGFCMASWKNGGLTTDCCPAQMVPEEHQENCRLSERYWLCCCSIDQCNHPHRIQWLE